MLWSSTESSVSGWISTSRPSRCSISHSTTGCGPTGPSRNPPNSTLNFSPMTAHSRSADRTRPGRIIVDMRVIAPIRDGVGGVGHGHAPCHPRYASEGRGPLVPGLVVSVRDRPPTREPQARHEEREHKEHSPRTTATPTRATSTRTIMTSIATLSAALDLRRSYGKWLPMGNKVALTALRSPAQYGAADPKLIPAREGGHHGSSRDSCRAPRRTRSGLHARDQRQSLASPVHGRAYRPRD